MLFQLWADQPYRATADLDLLRRGAANGSAIRDDVRTVLEQVVEPDDGVRFDAASVTVEPIRLEDEYGGMRARFVARLGSIRDRLQVDVGSGDAVWPAPKRVLYPVLLDDSSPRVLAYARETVIAEKLEAMVTLGIRNSRIKDFFDLHYLASHFDFDGHVICEAIQRTFARRNTPVPAEPIALTDEFWSDASRDAQVRAFARRARLEIDTAKPADIVTLLADFLLPVTRALAKGEPFDLRWSRSGPWQ